MKVPGIEGNYIWKYPHFAVRDPKSGKANLTFEQKKALLDAATEFKKNYKEWFLAAQTKLRAAVKSKKITEEQYETFLKRQCENVENITVIFDKAYTGEIYFDAKAFEAENLSAYETKRVYLELSRISYAIKSLESEKGNGLEKSNISTTEDINEDSLEISLADLNQPEEATIVPTQTHTHNSDYSQE